MITAMTMMRSIEDSDDMDDEVEILDEMAQDQVHYGSGGKEDWQSGPSE